MNSAMAIGGPLAGKILVGDGTSYRVNVCDNVGPISSKYERDEPLTYQIKYYYFEPEWLIRGDEYIAAWLYQDCQDSGDALTLVLEHYGKGRGQCNY